MLKRLICAVWGHLPWRVISETRFPPSPAGAVLHNGMITSEMYAELMRYNRRMHQGAHVITVTCDRCGVTRTIEH